MGAPEPSRRRLQLLDAGLPAPARGAFTTRAGGVSVGSSGQLNLALHVGDEPRRVLANRELLALELGVAELAFVHQVHGNGVLVIERRAPASGDAGSPDAGGMRDADALVTRERGLGLVVLAADCLPVLLADADAGVVAAAHAGRQGLLAGVLEAAVEAMGRLGARPERVRAVVGPAAGACCYEVPSEMAADAERALPGASARTRQGTAAVDLRAGARAALSAVGVTAVDVVDACTIEDERFYSHRRDPRSGRHAGVAWLTT